MIALRGGWRPGGRRDSFEHGGWSSPYGDAVMGEAMGARLAQSAGVLLGRRTFEDL